MNSNTLSDSTPKKHSLILFGTIGYLSLIILRPFEYWPWLGSLHIERIYIIFLLFAIALWRKKSFTSHIVNKTVILFLGVLTFSMFFAYHPKSAGPHVWEYFKLVVLYYVLLLSVNDEEDLKFIVIAFIAIMGIYIGKSLWEFFVHGRHTYQMGVIRLIGIDESLGDPNSFAATIVYSFPFVYALWKEANKNKHKLVLILYFIMAVSALALTGSRSGALTFMFFLGLIWIKGKRKFFMVFGIIILLLFSWHFLPDTYKNRLRTLQDDSINISATESADSRIQHWKWGFILYKSKPLFGWGPGSSPHITKDIIGHDESIQLHSLYAQILAELGTAGFISFMLIMISFYKTHQNTLKLTLTFKDYNKMTNYISIASINTMWLMLFNGMGGHNLYRYTWFWVGALLVMSNRFVREKYMQINHNVEQTSPSIYNNSYQKTV